MVILVMVSGAFLLFHNNKQESAVAKNNSSNTVITSSANEHHATNPQKNSSDTNDTSKLSTEIGPKETATAIAYYADKTGLDGWSNYLEGNDGIIVILDDNVDDLSKAGQGMSYGVLNEKHDYIGVTKNIYTIDRDNTVNIYCLTDEDSPDNPAEPIKSVSKDEIIQYLNNHGYASDVKDLSNNTSIDQSNIGQ
ncbi:hypothetical protein H5S09_06895 [Limosilactobacillus sp. STM2_1]|uniref:Uncharacterized protein n=1 Tax=Limosilactobacillus rudii TaxID=2759755 RepID=A0A7W3YNU5_9LACO|nr:hypothetical protein [Limosilactobacillus rudii]MBB1078781.1 hypothetical protein [Limosilactobacillus rudii]MBB1097667.1 hypothetical protein [Limosilactobacillus rudii]MCD7134776.1 hypothetical protein [Limosilactobacillus rudii]